MKKEDVLVMQFNYTSGKTIYVPLFRIMRDGASWKYFQVDEDSFIAATRYVNVPLVRQVMVLGVNHIESVFMYKSVGVDISEVVEKALATFDAENS